MDDFSFYLKEGVNHILDTSALDHLYFIVSFCLIYSFKNWRKILGLVTAFTLGHCLTLFLSGLELITIDSDLVETLIPITILASCINNYWLLFTGEKNKKSLILTYAILLFFGLIHGLGFSNYIKMMLFEDQSIMLPLLAFNIGIELAQLIIVAVFLGIIAVINSITNRTKLIKIGINTAIVILVIMMIF